MHIQVLAGRPKPQMHKIAKPRRSEEGRWVGKKRPNLTKKHMAPDMSCLGISQEMQEKRKKNSSTHWGATSIM